MDLRYASDSYFTLFVALRFLKLTNRHYFYLQGYDGSAFLFAFRGLRHNGIFERSVYSCEDVTSLTVI